MQTPKHFIIVRDNHGCTSHATIRRAVKPWPVLATCTCTAGPLHAAQNVARKAGFIGYRVELVPKTKEDWDAATNGYLSPRPGFIPTAISHVYLIVRS